MNYVLGLLVGLSLGHYLTAHFRSDLRQVAYTVRSLWHGVRHGHWAVTRTAEDWDCVVCERHADALVDDGEERVDGAVEFR